jgi:hypothetical protein
MRAKQLTKKGVKAGARNERAAASPLSPTALAEAKARAGAAEAELLAMLELEEAGVHTGVDGKLKGKAKGKTKGKGSCSARAPAQQSGGGSAIRIVHC